jgi:hypothetical protein
MKVDDRVRLTKKGLLSECHSYTVLNATLTAGFV